MTSDPTAWEAVLLGLEGSGVAGLLRGAMWLYPAVEILHIMGFVILVGMAFVLDLRLLGLWRRMPIVQAVHHLSRWAQRSLLLVVPTGVLLFMVDATALAGNPAFQIKLLLLAAAGVNAALFHWVTFRGVEGWDGDGPLPLPARLAGGLSILLWFSVIASGRLIAYV